MCDMNCFECAYDDCVNNSPPTKHETEILKVVLRDIKASPLKGIEKGPVSERHRKYYERNKERIKARQRAYTEAHRDEINARRRAKRKASKV